MTIDMLRNTRPMLGRGWCLVSVAYRVRCAGSRARCTPVRGNKNAGVSCWARSSKTFARPGRDRLHGALRPDRRASARALVHTGMLECHLCRPDDGRRVPTMCAAARAAHGSCGTSVTAFTRTAGRVSTRRSSSYPARRAPTGCASESSSHGSCLFAH